MLWDEEFKGPRWRYGLQFRPLGFAQVPDGWVLKSERPDSRFPTFGTVAYPRELTERETYGFNLVLIETPEGPVEQKTEEQPWTA